MNWGSLMGLVWLYIVLMILVNPWTRELMKKTMQEAGEKKKPISKILFLAAYNYFRRKPGAR